MFTLMALSKELRQCHSRCVEVFTTEAQGRTQEVFHKDWWLPQGGTSQDHRDSTQYFCGYSLPFLRALCRLCGDVPLYRRSNHRIRLSTTLTRMEVVSGK